MTPDPGDYFVVATKGWDARVIRWFTGSWANHAGIYLGDGLIMEANRQGVQKRSVHEYDHLPLVWSRRPLPWRVRERIIGAAEGMEGIPYGTLDIVAIALRRVPGAVGLLARVRLNRGDRLICSQLVARAYRAAGVNLVPSKPDNFVTPADLAVLVAPGGKTPPVRGRA